MGRMTDDELIAWLRASLAKTGKKQADLARILQISPGQVSRIFSAERRLKYVEVVNLAKALGVDTPAMGELRISREPEGIPVVGRISESLWTSEVRGGDPQRKIGAVLHAAYPAGDQVTFEVDSPGLPGEKLALGDFVIAVPFTTYRARPLPGDLLVCRRSRGDLSSYTLRRAAVEGGALVLRPVLEGSGDDPGEPHALVISVQSYQV
jgi:transcriptional regulator with XRE-family HTH domain